MSAEVQQSGNSALRGSWLHRLDFLWLELTSKCNLRCAHCYADAGQTSGEQMSYGKWSKVLREAFELGCRSVQFTGGEPSLHPDLCHLLKDARRIGFDSVEVYTNGTSFSQRLRDTLVKEAVDLAFSVYGPNSKVHDAITGRPGSLDKTLASIRWALGAGLTVRVSIIKMVSNSGDIAATKKLLRKLGVKSIYVDGVRAIGRANSHGPLKGHTVWSELCGECWRAKLAIDPRGNVFPCVFARFCKVGHVSQSLASVLGSEKLHHFRKEVRK